MTTALETRQLIKHFGGLMAIDKVDLVIPEHCIFSVIGPNGAGKTTFYNCITGFYTPDSGEILFYNESVVRPAAGPHHAGWAFPAPTRTSACSPT